MTTPRRGSCRASCRIALHPESKPALWQTQHSDGWQSTRWPKQQALSASDRPAQVPGSIQHGYAWAPRTQRDIFVDVCGPVDFESFQLGYARRADIDTYAQADVKSASWLCAATTALRTPPLQNMSAHARAARLHLRLQTRCASPGTLPSCSWCSCSVRHSANRPSPTFTVLQKMSYAAVHAPAAAEPTDFSSGCRDARLCNAQR